VSRVLVTGAGGFIGRHTLFPLLAAGHEVHAVTSRPLSGGMPAAAGPPEDALREMPPEVRWHRADLLAPEAARALMQEVQPSHLLHLAWYTQPQSYRTTLENLDWVQASLRLLRAFGELEGQRAVLAGTCAEYAWERYTHCVEEAPSPARAGEPPPTRMCPATLYGAAKYGLYVVAERWASQVGVALAWGRIFYSYGPHEHPVRLVSGVARALLRGEEALCTHGMQVCDYLYTPEMGGALAALLISEVTGPVNLASGRPVRVTDVVAAIAAAAGRPELVRLGALPQRPGEPDRLTADVRRLREEVGWSPSVDLHEGAARTVEWWKRALATEGAGGGPSSAAAGGGASVSDRGRHVPGRSAGEQARPSPGAAADPRGSRRSGGSSAASR
jgi:nucleoside-diphosphate-sugar epimerase